MSGFEIILVRFLQQIFGVFDELRHPDDLLITAAMADVIAHDAKLHVFHDLLLCHLVKAVEDNHSEG